jgi:hypothetical protein
MHIHVFTIDIFPFPGFVCSGGSLRSWQIISGLRRLGATVTYSMPANAPLIKQQWDQLTAEDRENCFDGQPAKHPLDLINKFRPDATLIQWPLAFSNTAKLRDGTITVLDINGFQNFESVGFLNNTAHFQEETRRYLQKIIGADILITGSPQQRAYWGGLLGYYRSSLAATEMIDVPFCIDNSLIDSAAQKPYTDGGPLFLCTGTFLPWNSPEGNLTRLARIIDTVGRGKMLVVGQPILSLPHSRQVLQEIEAVSRFPFATVVPGMPFPAMVEMITRSAVAVDLHLPTFERQFALPVRTMTYLGLGLPVIFNNYSTLAAQVEHYGAGICLDPRNEQQFEDAIKRILSERDDIDLSRMSDAAIGLITENYYGDACMRSLHERIEQKFRQSSARLRKTTLAGQKPGGPLDTLFRPFIKKLNLPRVLVISDEYENLQEVRVHLPFRTMRQQQLIEDYVVMSNGRLVKPEGSGIRDVDVVWVQRRPSKIGLFAPNMFGEKFVLDIDDNLLAAPAYIRPFTNELTAVLRTLLRSAGTVTTTNSRLVDAIQRYSGILIQHKIVIAPNMTENVHEKDFGRPQALLLASSDILPLTTSKGAFAWAVRRFTELRDLPLLYIGHAGVPLEEVKQMAKVVQHVNILSYQRYLHVLRNAPIMGVVPLEGHGDPVTNDFICSKSDIKMVEYGAASVPAVYSRVAPYLDSSLQCGPLVEFSDSNSLVHALDSVFTDASRHARQAYESVRGERLATAVVDRWYEAIDRERLSHPVSLELIEAQAIRYSGYLAEDLPSRAQFDEATYAANNSGAVEWVQSTGRSLHEHYLRYGRQQGLHWHVADPGISVEEMAARVKEEVVRIDQELPSVSRRIATALGNPENC